MGYIIFTIYFLAILAVLYFIPKRRQMKQAKKNGSLTGAMGGQAAYTKEQQFLAKEQFAAYRKTVYADHAVYVCPHKFFKGIYAKLGKQHVCG